MLSHINNDFNSGRSNSENDDRKKETEEDSEINHELKSSIQQLSSNSKLGIYESIENDYMFRVNNLNDMNTFEGSAEQKLIQDNNVRLLMTVSDLVYYTMSKNNPDLHSSKKELKNLIRNSTQNKIYNRPQEEIAKIISKIEAKKTERFQFFSEEVLENLLDMFLGGRFNAGETPEVDFYREEAM